MARRPGSRRSGAGNLCNIRVNLNPLGGLLAKSIDFDCVRSCQAIRLSVSATNAETGRFKVSCGHELTADVVMASACLPHPFQGPDPSA